MTSYTIDTLGHLRIQVTQSQPLAATSSTSSNNSLGRTVATNFTDNVRKVNLTGIVHSQKTDEAEPLFKSKLDMLYTKVADNLRLLSKDSYAKTDVSAIILNEFFITLELLLKEGKVGNPLPFVISLWNNFFDLIHKSPHKQSLMNYIFNRIQYVSIASSPSRRLIAVSFLDSFLKQVLMKESFNTLVPPVIDFLLGNYENVENYFQIATEKEKDDYAALFFVASYINSVATTDKYANLGIDDITNEIMLLPGYVNLQGLPHQFQALAYIIKGSYKNYPPNYFVNKITNAENSVVSPIEEAIHLICLFRNKFQDHGIVRVPHARLYLKALYTNKETPPLAITACTPSSTPASLQKQTPEVTPSTVALLYSRYLAENRSLITLGKTLSQAGTRVTAELLALLISTTTPDPFRELWKQIASHLERRSGVQTDLSRKLAQEIAHVEAAALKGTYFRLKNPHYVYLLSFIKEIGLKFMTHFYADIPREILQAFWQEDWAVASQLCQNHREKNITLFQIGVIAEQKKCNKSIFYAEEMENILNLFSFSKDLTADVRSKLIKILCTFDKYMEKIGKGTQGLVHDKFELFTCYRENIQKGFAENRVFIHPILYPEFIRKIIKENSSDNGIIAECHSLLAHFPLIQGKRRLEEEPFTSNKKRETKYALQERS